MPFLKYAEAFLIMKLKYLFESVDMGDEIIAVPVGDNASEIRGVIKLNKEGFEIFELLKYETTEAAIVDTLCAKYENRREQLTDYVHKIIHTFTEVGIIAE